MKSLNLNTVTKLLLDTLIKLMSAEEFTPFRLVGGTSLSLQLGHRLSVDIDLFSDYEYGTIDFDSIDSYLRKEFSYVDTSSIAEVSFGKSYYIGDSDKTAIKLDLFYTDPFIQPAVVIDNVRLATIEEIAAMKIDVVSRAGRKKDFWDLHELSETIPFGKMLDLHRQRYPYTDDREAIIAKLTDFSYADRDFDPQCFRGKYWELIKLDIVELTQDLL